MKGLVDALRDDDRAAALVIGAGVVAHALISGDPTLPANEVAQRAFELSDAFITEAERRFK